MDAKRTPPAPTVTFLLRRLVLLLLALAASSGAPAAELPHIVLIVADDLGAGDLGCYNPASKVPTPRMDRLAAEGVRWTDMHSPSAVCTPTRYGILTGRYAWRTRLQRGVLLGDAPNLIEEERLTLAEALKTKGYATACIGKWHLGLGSGETTDFSRPLVPSPLTHGFDEFFGIPASLDFEPYVYVEGDRAVEQATETVAASTSQREGGGGYWRAGAIAPGFRHADVLAKLTERAVGLIARCLPGPSTQPLFLYLPLSAPHTPWLPSPEFRGASGAGPYGDFVVEVDAAVGKVLDAIDRAGASRETLVVLTSDNGAHWTPVDIARYGHRSNLAWRGQKADAYEGGHRVPFVARWPGRIAPATVSSQLGCLTDLFATLAALTGAEIPHDAAEDSFDLSPALLGRPSASGLRDAVVHHSGNGVFAVRKGRWKLIAGLGSGGFSAPSAVAPEPGGPDGQLFDLESDPAEARDLFPSRPEVVAELRALLERLRREGRSRSAGPLRRRL